MHFNSINLSAQKDGTLIINIVNLFAYLINDSTIYSHHDSSQNLLFDAFTLDFQSPIQPYKLLKSATYTNENSDRLLSSLERVISLITSFRNNANNQLPAEQTLENAQATTDQIGDWISRRTTARSMDRFRRRRLIEAYQKGHCCFELVRYLLMLLTLALFPAVFILILMNQVMEQLSFSNTLPLSNTLCLVTMQCPHKREKNLRDHRNDTMLFLESNGDIYHKAIGKGEKFYIRGECVIAFDKKLSSVKVCNYGQNGANLREYRCNGDFIEFIGPGNLWYGNGRQDLLSNAYKLKSLLFCDNLAYLNPNFVPNLNDVRGDASSERAMVGNYANGRFGVIESFELRQRYKVKCGEKCLILSTLTLVMLSFMLFIITMHLQPNFLDILLDEINEVFRELRLP